MTSATRSWCFLSAGLPIRVRGPAELPAWWPRLAPQIPGVNGDPLTAADGPVEVVLPEDAGPGDARRRINAGVHVEHLRHGTLVLHAVGVAKDGRAMLLLGDHGAGKSLTAVALVTEWGWRPVAGDAAVARVAGGQTTLIGGTSLCSLRRSAVRAWFPTLAVPADDGPDIDLSEQLLPGQLPAGAVSAVVAAAMPHVDGSMPGSSEPQPCAAHVARNAVYRASGHLIDKVLDDPDADPLRLAEEPDLTRRRLRLARVAADSLGLSRLHGTPQAMAAALDRWATGREVRR